MSVYKLVYALFCEHHSVDANGRNTYTSVFDEQTLLLKTLPDKPKPRLPLPRPQATAPFVLALRLQCPANTESCWLELKDTHNQPIGPRATLKLATHPKGAHRVHFHFQNGIPVMDQGTYVFEIGVGETPIGTAELPVNIRIL